MLAERRSDVAINRQILDDRYSSHLGGQEAAATGAQPRDVTVLDVLVDDALREDFVTECENLLLFDSVYDQIIEHLDTIAEEAESTRALSKRTITKLLDTTLAQAARTAVNGNAGTASGEAMVERLRGQFFRWFLRVADTPRSTDFFRAVEEWKKTSFPHLSDTLFVVVTFLFERLLGMHLQSEKDRRRYDGRISPRAIGRRKDFWNRLTIAYRDLRIQEVVEEYKGRKATGYRAFIDTFFTDFEELYSDLLSSDPCEFPGFRISIESALKAQDSPVRHRHRHRHVQRRRRRHSCRRGHLEHRLPGRRVRHGERGEILQAAGRLRGAAIAGDRLHFVRRHADERRARARCSRWRP